MYNDIINKEYKRLKLLFCNIEESKSELIDNLINQAAIIKMEHDNLQNQLRKYGAV